METVETLNGRLVDHYGIDSSTSRPIFRIVWAEDETEVRKVTHSDAGIQFIQPRIMEVRKYSYLRNVYVLERLVAVAEPELLTQLSYEPVWVFQDAEGNPLPPIWDATKLVVDVLYAALGKKGLAKYVEDVSPEAQEQRISEIAEELFGNETETGDALAYGEAVTVPHNYEKDK